MPTNTSIPSHSYRDLLSSADWDTLSPLNNSIGVYATSGALTGSAPAVNAPNFLIIAGVQSESVTAGNVTINFTSAFPNGIICAFLQCVQTTLTGNNFTITPNVHDINTSAIVAQVFNNGSAFTGDVEVQYFILGF